MLSRRDFFRSVLGGAAAGIVAPLVPAAVPARVISLAPAAKAGVMLPPLATSGQTYRIFCTAAVYEQLFALAAEPEDPAS